jgi:hypothetical protein
MYLYVQSAAVTAGRTQTADEAMASGVFVGV